MKNNFTPSLGSIFLKPAGANPLAFYCRYGLNLICVLIFGGAFQSALHAQTPPDLAWEVNYGSNSNDEARNIIQTSDGGYLVVGEVNGGTGDVAGSGYLGNSDGWVVKLNPSGTILWKKAYGTSSYDLGIFQAIEVSDGYVLVGSTYFSGGFSTDKLWYAKVAKSTGVPLANWTFQYNSTGQSVGHTIVTTPDGGFLIGGTLYDNGSKALLLKTNSAGVVTSTYTSNPSGGLWGKVITQIEKTPDSGYALLGAYHDINEPGCNPNAEVSDRYDVWVCKFSSTFSAPWSKIYGGTTTDYPRDIVVVPDGNIFVLGNTGCTGATTGPNNVGVGDWLMKTNSTGILQDVQIVSVSLLDFGKSAYGLGLSCDDQILVCGQSGSF